MPMTATMSPAPAESISSRLSACILHDAAEALLLAGALVEVHFALVDRALVDAHEGQLAERIFDDLEGHAHERLGRIGLERELLVGLSQFLALIGRSSGEGK